jgi:UDPglucose--hexose-1-phosphate uridylyltransferase
MPSEIRKDYLQDRYVIIAPKRGKRPHDIERPEVVNENPSKVCAFCPANVDKKHALLTVGPKKRWHVKVIANDFPAVDVSNPKAYGRQEVVIETPNHIVELDDLPVEHIVKVLEAYSTRTREISKDKKIEYILTFKNNGGKAGASLQHPHSQIFATAFLPPHLFDKSQKALAYKLEHGTCAYCDIIAKEQKGKRFIWKDENIIAFTPYASFHNYEAWIMPFRHLDNITSLNADERLSMAKILKHLLRKIGDLHLPYNFYFHQIIHDKDQHFYMKVTPRGNVWAGVEIGSGLIINPVSPEDAASFFRSGLQI